MKIECIWEWRSWVPKGLRYGFLQSWPLMFIFMRERWIVKTGAGEPLGN